MADPAIVIYPNSTLTIPINWRDRIDVTYSTSWAATNLTLLCKAPDSTVFDSVTVPDNPLPDSGHYLTTNIMSMSLNLFKFPATCRFRLTEFGNITEHRDSALFNLMNVDIPPRTFAIDSTIGLQPTSTATSAIATSRTNTLTTNTESPRNSTSPSSSGNNVSTSAAIGIGVTLAVFLVLAAVVFWIFYQRRKRRSHIPKNIILTKPDYFKPELQGNDSFVHPAERYGSEKRGYNVGAVENGTPSTVFRYGSPSSPYEYVSPTGAGKHGLLTPGRYYASPRLVEKEGSELPPTLRAGQKLQRVVLTPQELPA